MRVPRGRPGVNTRPTADIKAIDVEDGEAEHRRSDPRGWKKHPQLFVREAVAITQRLGDHVVPFNCNEHERVDGRDGSYPAEVPQDNNPAQKNRQLLPGGGLWHRPDRTAES